MPKVSDHRLEATLSIIAFYDHTTSSLKETVDDHSVPGEKEKGEVTSNDSVNKLAEHTIRHSSSDD